MPSQFTSSSTRRPKLYVGTACDQCFRTKARCAGERPVCMRCKLNNTSCTYSTGRKKRAVSTQEVSRASDEFTYASSSSSTSSIDPHGQQQDQSAKEPDLFDSTEQPFQIQNDAQGESTSYPQPTAYIQQPPDPLHYSEQSMTGSSSMSFDSEPWNEQTELQTPNSKSQSVDSFSLTFPEMKLSVPASENWYCEQHTQLGSIGEGGGGGGGGGGESQSQILSQQQRFQNPTTFPLQPGMTGGADTSTALGQTLAQLHAYDLGVGVANPDETLTRLQQSLSIVGNYISNAEAAESRDVTNSSSSSAAPCGGGAGQQQTPSTISSVSPSHLNVIMAMTCSHTIQLAFACYAKMRGRHGAAPPFKHLNNGPQQGSPPLSEGELQAKSTPHGSQTTMPTPTSTPQQHQQYQQQTQQQSQQTRFDSPPCPTPGLGPSSDAMEDLTREQSQQPNVCFNLLDFYITHDMRLCQSLAERLIAWCCRLAFSAQHEHGRHAPETAAAIKTMIMPLEACTLMAF